MREDRWSGTSILESVALSQHQFMDEARREASSPSDARLWHPWLRINRVLRVMLRTRWSTDAWSQVRIEFGRALALRSEIRHPGWFN